MRRLIPHPSPRCGDSRRRGASEARDVVGVGLRELRVGATHRVVGSRDGVRLVANAEFNRICPELPWARRVTVHERCVRLSDGIMRLPPGVVRRLRFAAPCLRREVVLVVKPGDALAVSCRGPRRESCQVHAMDVSRETFPCGRVTAARNLTLLGAGPPLRRAVRSRSHFAGREQRRAGQGRGGIGRVVQLAVGLLVRSRREGA